MIRALIFDFDGLILDTETPEYIAWRETYEHLGCELSFDVWMKYIGVQWGTYDPFEELEALLGRPVDREAINTVRRARNRELLEAEPILPGVEAYIRDAKRLGLRVGLASSSPRHWVYGHLDRIGLTAEFESIKCAEDVAQTKPSPDLYLAALQAFDIAADEAIALEDSLNGILAATRAGVYCVVVPNPVTCNLPLEQANYRLKSLAELPLEGLLKIVEAERKSGDVLV